MLGNETPSFVASTHTDSSYRIIKDFYITLNEPAKRPKIFGMTASPVDARVDPVQAAK